MKMDGLELMFNFLEKARKDARIGPVHISLFMAMIKCWSEDGCGKWLVLDKDLLMNMSKIFSFTTYHKVMRELHNSGYITYDASSSKWESSKVYFNLMDFKVQN